jgi:hypothetical protein
MTFGKILENLVKRKVKNYDLEYDQHHEISFKILKDIPDLSELKVSPILLVSDRSPNSLISIAYAIKITNSLGKDRKFYALTQGKHSEIIKNECKENKVQLMSLVEKEHIEIEDIYQMVTKFNIGMIIVSYDNQLIDSIINRIPVSVLVTSIKNIR